MPAGLASSWLAPASTAISRCIITYGYRLRACASARCTHQRHSGRRLRGSLEQLRLTGLLNLEHRELSHYCSSCSIGDTVRVYHENPGQAKAQGVRRLLELRHQRHTSWLPEEPGSNKGPGRSETAQAAASRARLVPVNSTRVE